MCVDGVNLVNHDPRSPLETRPVSGVAVDELVGAAAQGLVAIGTDTIYALATRASPDGLARIVAARRAMEANSVLGPSTWHAPAADRVLRALPSLNARHRWVISKLWPGPFTLMLPMTDDDRAACAAAGIEPGLVDDARSLFARVPESGVFSELLHRAPWPVLAERIRFGPTDDRGATDLAEATALLARAGIQPERTIEASTQSLGRPSALIRLDRSGSWELVRASVFDRAYVQRRLTRRVLFICTGNTCRSPMAQALATGLWAASGQALNADFPLIATSAGLHAEVNSPPTPEGIAALRSLGFRPPSGGARAVTAEMLREADAIYTMTRAHLDEVNKLDPRFADKAQVLDSEGHDIPDPLGGPARLYASLAVAMRDMIARRLQEVKT